VTPQRRRDPSPFQPILNEVLPHMVVEQKDTHCSVLEDASTDSKKKKRRKKKKNNSDDYENQAENPELLRCYNCDLMGHLSRDCTIPRSCFLCGDTGHVAKQCKFSALVQVEDRAPTPVDDKICLNCNEAGHRLKNCPYGRKCFQCGNIGHVARECPSVSERIRMMQKYRDTPSPDLSVSSFTSPAPTSASTLRSHSSNSSIRNACSPPLFFGSSAFSSFHNVQQSVEVQGEEVDDAHFEDLITNLLTDLDVDENR